MVEDNVLFTYHLAGKQEIPVEVVECYHSAWGGHGSSWLKLAQTGSYQLLCMTSEQCNMACHVTSDLDFNKEGCVIQI